MSLGRNNAWESCSPLFQPLSAALQSRRRRRPTASAGLSLCGVPWRLLWTVCNALIDAFDVQQGIQTPLVSELTRGNQRVVTRSYLELQTLCYPC